MLAIDVCRLPDCRKEPAPWRKPPLRIIHLIRFRLYVYVNMTSPLTQQKNKREIEFFAAVAQARGAFDPRPGRHPVLLCPERRVQEV